MPELPEVETIVRDLRPRVVGRTFTRFRALTAAPTPVRDMTPAQLDAALRGRRIESIERRGKYLLFVLSGGLTLVAHLRMTGALLHRRPSDEADAYTRVVLSLDDGTELRFADLRRFGTLRLVEDAEQALGTLGVEPLGPEFTVERLARLAGTRTSAPVKSFLMDQAVAAGMGNIYADESLFVARIDPRRAAASLKKAEVKRLHGAIRAVLEQGVANRGVSFRNYRDVAGNAGNNQHYVSVFRRTGQPCDMCGTAIERVKLGGRSTHFCPRCQR